MTILYLKEYVLQYLILNNMLSLFQKMKKSMESWLGKKNDYDNAYWAQCVDWAKQYAIDIWYPIGYFSGSALNGWRTGSPFTKPWIRVEYKEWMKAEPGSIIFFNKTPKNEWWHVAVVVSSTEKTVTVQEQNAGNGRWDWLWANAITKRTYTYKKALVWDVLGWYKLP